MTPEQAVAEIVTAGAPLDLRKLNNAFSTLSEWAIREIDIAPITEIKLLTAGWDRVVIGSRLTYRSRPLGEVSGIRICCEWTEKTQPRWFLEHCDGTVFIDTPKTMQQLHWLERGLKGDST